MKEPVGPRPSDAHQLHDRLLVARAAGDDLEPSERRGAEALLTACADCRSLEADLRMLSAAAASLPVPRRSREFRLSAEDAARLRRSRLQRWLAPLAGPGFGLIQPLAGAAIVIGMLLVVLNSLPFQAAGPGGGGAMPAGAGTGAPAGEPAPALPGGAGAGGAMATAAATPEFQAEPGASPATDSGAEPRPTHERQAGGQAEEQPRRTAEPAQGPGGPAVPGVALVGILLMAAGVLLLIVRRAARRAMEDAPVR